MTRSLVTLVPENSDGTSMYENAIRNCCERGGYDLKKSNNEGNREVKVRLHTSKGEDREVSGYPNAAELLLKERTTHPIIIDGIREHFRTLTTRPSLEPALSGRT